MKFITLRTFMKFHDIFKTGSQRQFMNFFNEYILICNKKKRMNKYNALWRVNPLPKKKSEFTLKVLLKTLVDLFTKLSELFTRSDLFTIMSDLITTPFDLLTLLVGHKLSNQLGVGGVPEPHPAVPSSRNQVGPTPC